MKNKSHSVVLGVLLILSGCGSDNKGSSNAYQSGSDYCSQQYINDLNAWGNAVNASTDADTANSLTNGFESKYRNVHCKGLDANTYQDKYFDTNEMVAKVRAEIARVSKDLCTQSFLNDRNAIARASGIDQVEALLNTYESKYKGVRCKAKNQATGAEMWIDVNQDVVEIRQKIASVRPAPTTPTKPQVLTPVPSTSSTPVATGNPRASAIDANITDIKAVSVEVTDAASLNRVKNARGDSIIQGGRVLSMREITDFNSNLCFITAIATNDFTAGQKLEFSKISVEGDGTLNLSSTSGYVSVVCMRRDGKRTPWTVSEVQSIFGRLANVNPIR
ncbi:MAG: hypothetical protein JST80_04875 [Bdellovibrionales bacterium]|nr:hypothetical protein [Bdellovibrionales bacterium]